MRSSGWLSIATSRSRRKFRLATYSSSLESLRFLLYKLYRKKDGKRFSTKIAISSSIARLMMMQIYKTRMLKKWNVKRVRYHCISYSSQIMMIVNRRIRSNSSIRHKKSSRVMKESKNNSKGDDQLP